MDSINDRLERMYAMRLRKRQKSLRESLDLVEKRGFDPAVLWHFAKSPEGISDNDRRRIERALGLSYLYCGSAPITETEPKVEQRLADVQILRVLRCKPSKIGDVLELENLRADAEYILLNCCSLKIDAFYELKAFVSEAKQARMKLLIEDINERISVLKRLADKEVQAEKRAMQAAAHFADIDEDSQLAGALWHALDIAPPAVGFVYFKRWSMPDGSHWFKIGITNNPDRREIEQNVLPVAAETIACVDVGSMDRAKMIEAVIHKVLQEQRITDANNRELFHLSDQQVSAVKAVLEKLE
jgi:hypothetical protein